jgi:hypothetical protein
MLSRIAILFVLALGVTTAEEAKMTGAEASRHAGESGTVCGKVAGTRYIERAAKQPTFLNFDKPYPDHSFTVVIFGENRSKFGKPEEDYQDKDLCASGKIILFQGKPEIVASEPSQLKAGGK